MSPKNLPCTCTVMALTGSTIPIKSLKPCRGENVHIWPRSNPADVCKGPRKARNVTRRIFRRLFPAGHETSRTDTDPILLASFPGPARSSLAVRNNSLRRPGPYGVPYVSKLKNKRVFIYPAQSIQIQCRIYKSSQVYIYIQHRIYISSQGFIYPARDLYI